MPDSFLPPQQRPSWQRLQALAQQPLPDLRTLLQQPDARCASLQLQACGLRLDARRQRLTDAVLDALYDLAEESALPAQIEAQRCGALVNATEGRAALHPALRAPAQPGHPWGDALTAQIAAERERFLHAAQTLHQGQWLGHGGRPIRHVVNLGIGGSDLGPHMVCTALAAHTSPELQLHFVSNPDPWSLYQTLRSLDAAQTLFVVQSKSFTTPETLLLAAAARAWLSRHGIDGPAQGAHLIAVTAVPELAQAQGYLPQHTYTFWDWVGGRYSVWSAIGLPVAAAVGAAAFGEFLAGGHAMDQHFWHSPARHNLPLLLALLGIWNRNFLDTPTLCLAAYSSRLQHLAHFLRQLDMESNGKSTHIDGSAVQIGTGPIVWGGLGVEGQHAFFQLLHQGRHRVTLDFIGIDTDDTPLPEAQTQHRLVNLSLRAQADALALGRDAAATASHMRLEGCSEAEVQRLLPHRTFAGNVPSNTLWLPALTPHTLGALVALYEHKVFCQAAIWGINPYDQWGVELGKTLVKAMEHAAETTPHPPP